MMGRWIGMGPPMFGQASGVRSRRCLIQRRDRVWPVYHPCPAEPSAAIKQKRLDLRLPGLPAAEANCTQAATVAASAPA